jgi:hypothetical protein
MEQARRESVTAQHMADVSAGPRQHQATVTRSLLTAFVALSLWQGEAITRELQPPVIAPAIARPAVEKLLGCDPQGFREYQYACATRERMSKVKRIGL